RSPRTPTRTAASRRPDRDAHRRPSKARARSRATMIDGEGRLARLVNDPSPSPPRAPDPSPSETAAREAVDRLLQAHGAEVHRYSAATVRGDETGARPPHGVGHQ